VTATVLIVEDEVLQARSIKRSLERHGYDVLVAASAEEGLTLVQRHHPDILLLDLHLPGMGGLAMLKAVREQQAHLQVIMITAYGNVQTAVEAMRLGAHDYITKPLDLEELRLLLERLQTHIKHEQELSYLRAQHRRTPHANLPLGQSPRMQELETQLQTFATLERRAGAGAPPVLLLGETGTGKGFVARLLHALSPRSQQPFIEVNCAALPDTLLEAELFGYEKGAFTDARTAKRGLFEAADGGFIFLDEIGHSSLDAQAKLLHVIETHRFRRLGALGERRVDVRIIAATNVNLEAAAARGTFRADLYHRLHVLTLHLPPLRERGEDIFLLADHFIQYHCRQYGLAPRQLSRSAKERLMLYPWPGNVRELANEIERALLLESGEVLELTHLTTDAPQRLHAALRLTSPEQVAVELPPQGIAFAIIERHVLQQALYLCQWNVAKTARFLRMSRDTLRYRMERLGLHAPEPLQVE
jgi:DNA-binding NtrC family response regulator